MKSILIALFLVVGLAGCENPVTPKNSATITNWKWIQSVPSGNVRNTIVEGILPIAANGDSLWGSVLLPNDDGRTISVKGQRTFSVATLRFTWSPDEYGNSIWWTTHFRYVNADTMAGYSLASESNIPWTGLPSDTAEWDTLVRQY